MREMADEESWLAALTAREAAQRKRARAAAGAAPVELDRPANDERVFDRAAIPWVYFPAALAADKTVKLGVRGAALVWHIVSSLTRVARAKGRSKLDRFGLKKAAVWDTVENFGRAVGLCARQTRRLFRQAEKHKLISVRRATNRVWVQLTDAQLLPTRVDRQFDLRFFHRELADQIGVNESILFLLIQSEGRKGCYISLKPSLHIHENWHLKMLPWMNAAGLQRALWKLEKLGWVRWDTFEASERCRRYVALKAWKVPTNANRFLRADEAARRAKRKPAVGPLRGLDPV